ncbi:MAG TPA: adenylate/guanylate cyclase domain-containing protein [Actinomycetota bacterium]|nr:adenylate/guanylate cyclase domain-containing protein [Actinomycetota bacterium]
MATCPYYGAENPHGARFCNACGASMQADDVRRKERKFATALFADLVGSTSPAERGDPEVVHSIVGRTFDRLAEEIARYEGLLEKFMGNAVLAVLGVPRAHEGVAERAVPAAHGMHSVPTEVDEALAGLDP